MTSNGRTHPLLRVLSRRAATALAASAALLVAGGAGAHGTQLSVAITAGPEGATSSTTAELAFAANERSATFACSLDDARPTPCTSPVTYSGLAPGPHLFTVTAAAGRESASASRRWVVEAPQSPPSPPAPGPKEPPPGDTPPPKPAPPCEAPGKVVVCFDDLVVGADVHSQYAADGVEFGFTASNAGGSSGVFPVIAPDPGAHSAPRVARTPACSGDFCTAVVHGRLAWESSFVEVWVGGGARVTLTAFNRLGFPLDDVTTQSSETVSTLLRVARAKRDIAYFDLAEDAPAGQQRSTILYDDLAFEPPDPAMAPEFGLGWSAPTLDGWLGIATGHSKIATISLARFNGSSGDVALSVHNLPTGVSAMVAPATAKTETTTVKVTVTVAANAPLDKRLMEVRGHPTAPSAGTSDHSTWIPLSVLFADYDVEVTGIEVNQGIQTQLTTYYDGTALSATRCKSVPSLPRRDASDPGAPVPYQTETQVAGPNGLPAIALSSVPLLAHRRTVVRVYARVREPVGAVVNDVPAVLYGRRNGQPLPGSPLSPDDGPHNLETTASPWATCYDRADPKGAYTFTLPSAWRDGTISLRAKLTPDEMILPTGGECGSAACLANNELRLSGVEFEPRPTATVKPIALPYTLNGLAKAPPPPGQAFAQARFMTPGKLVFSGGSDASYAGVLDISGYVNDPLLPATPKVLCSVVLDFLETFVPPGGAVVGVFSNSADVCAGVTDGGFSLDETGFGYSIVAANRPLTSVAHELFHAFGRPHYGQDPACYPDFNQIGIAWLPDQRGHIHGIGLDTRAGSGGGNGPYRVVVPGALVPGDPFGQNAAAEISDFMSYCNVSDQSMWISDRGWSGALADLRSIAFGAPLRRRPAASARVEVTAVAGDGVRATILHVGASSGRTLGGDPAQYRVVARDDTGRTLSDTAMVAASDVVHGAGTVVQLRGEADAAAASIELTRAGAVVARRVRSAHRPTIEVTEPRAGQLVGVGKQVAVRWKAADADGDRLTVTVELSLDAGHAWRTVYAGPSAAQVVLPASLFPRSRAARVRVRVDDGFDSAFATSGPFVSAGRRPTVAILEPIVRTRVRADATVSLEGSAYDDTGVQLDGSRLTWIVGDRIVGRGADASIRLDPGVHAVELRARDAFGRTGSASTRVRVLAVAPHVLDLRAPARLAPGARRLTFRLATTVPATLRAAGRAYAVGRSLRALTVPVRPGRNVLRFPLRLTSHGRTSVTTLVVPRERRPR
jgi:hypothetical protein